MPRLKINIKDVKAVESVGYEHKGCYDSFILTGNENYNQWVVKENY
jgi:hypothetical protein